MNRLISCLHTANRRPISWIRVVTVGLASALVLLYFVWSLGGQYILKLHARLYQAPIPGIQTIRMSPTEHFSLIAHDVIITNVSSIQGIMTSIRSAVPYSPNHPTIRWSCYLTVLSSSGTSYISVHYCPGIESGECGNASCLPACDA